MPYAAQVTIEVAILLLFVTEPLAFYYQRVKAGARTSTKQKTTPSTERTTSATAPKDGPVSQLQCGTGRTGPIRVHHDNGSLSWSHT
jgi:hypothetical protein